MVTKKYLSVLFILLLSIPILAKDKNRITIIPHPVSINTGEGVFSLNKSTSLITNTSDIKYIKIIKQFADEFNDITSASLVLKEPGNKKGDICFFIDTSLVSKIGNEGYKLKITRNKVIITAVNESGWFYAGRTLLQLIEQEKKKNKYHYFFPCVEIEDYPRFSWRGLMLDVSRHFFSKEELKSYIHQMAKYKFNIFHLHLTDNQGWRIEIKSLPNLTKVGAWRVPRTGYWKGFLPPQPGEETTYGGFYTHEDIKELVAFAKERNVTIIPEIDVPGHSLALIASYPELSCTKKPQQVLAGDPWNVSRTNVLCVSNDSVYDVLDKIVTELSMLFPSEYIHIGGDEVNRIYWKKCSSCQSLIKKQKLKDENELQTYFIQRLSNIVKSKGKKVIGWYENLPGGLIPEMTYMSWKDYKGGIIASQKGHKVVMTPAFFTYLDFYQGDPAMENGPFTVCRLSNCYAFNPEQKDAISSNILGGQGSLWTEQVPNERKLQYMTWPRGLALAEVLWSPQEKRDWSDFVTRMEAQFPKFEEYGINYSKAFYEPILHLEREDGELFLVIETEVSDLRIFYSFDDCSPDMYYPEYKKQKVKIPKGAHHIRAISYKNGQPIGREINISIQELLSRIPQ